jgi:hypothetical protein
MRVILALALLASASAFAPNMAPKSASSALMAKGGPDFGSAIGAPKNTEGITDGWDPLGLLDGADQERFDRLRTVELKHGRISMLAILGHITTTAGVRLPGYLSPSSDIKFSDIPSGLAAFSKLPFAGVMQVVVFVGALELFVMQDITGEAEFVGDYRNGYIDFGWAKKDAEWQTQKREIEINNGRAAMMGILALMVHEGLNNDPYVINSLFGAPVDFNAGF